MKERPILFSSAMIRAILEGRKSQTRRVVKWKPRQSGLNLSASSLQLGHYFTGKTDSGYVLRSMSASCWEDRTFPIKSPYGNHGDRLWLRETFAENIAGCPNGVTYRADHVDPNGDGPANPITWRPSIFMPRKASRITLEITGVRVERLQEISEADAKAEGVEGFVEDGCFVYRDYECGKGTWCFSAKGSFRSLWGSINGAESWKSNPWVWVVEFKAVDA